MVKKKQQKKTKNLHIGLCEKKKKQVIFGILCHSINTVLLETCCAAYFAPCYVY